MSASTNEIPAWANRIAAWFFALICAYFVANWMSTVTTRLDRIEVALFIPATINHTQAAK